jgi:hypothetical protein
MPLIEVSNGDLADKLSILQIKKEKLKNPEQLKNVDFDFLQLSKEFSNLNFPKEAIKSYQKLYEENLRIWNLMQKLFDRDFEEDETFELVAIATVECNVRRAYFKRDFDILTKSNLIEEKSYFETK